MEIRERIKTVQKYVTHACSITFIDPDKEILLT